MRVLTRSLNDLKTVPLRITPIGDTHVGAAASDEERLRKLVSLIAKEEDHYWIGMGDYCDFINKKDPRFSVDSLADWLITRNALADLTKAQRDMFLDTIKPIADKCLGLVMGNHETAITKHYERDVYSEIVTAIKEWANMPESEPLGIGYYGWLLLSFYRQTKRKKRAVNQITLNLHHGFVGGKLAGAKALNMQRWLWTHQCDVAVFGHSHNTASQSESVEAITSNGQLTVHVRRGCYSGTFLGGSVDNGSSTYSEIKGYFPLPIGGCQILLYPYETEQPNRVRILV